MTTEPDTTRDLLEAFKNIAHAMSEDEARLERTYADIHHRTGNLFVERDMLPINVVAQLLLHPNEPVDGEILEVSHASMQAAERRVAALATSFVDALNLTEEQMIGIHIHHREGTFSTGSPCAIPLPLDHLPAVLRSR